MNLVTCLCTGSSWTPDAAYNDFPLLVTPGTTVTAPLPESVRVPPASTSPASCNCGFDFKVTMADGTPLPTWITYDKATEALTVSPPSNEPLGSYNLMVHHWVNTGDETYDVPISVEITGCSIMAMDPTSVTSFGSPITYTVGNDLTPALPTFIQDATCAPVVYSNLRTGVGSAPPGFATL